MQNSGSGTARWSYLKGRHKKRCTGEEKDKSDHIFLGQVHIPVEYRKFMMWVNREGKVFCKPLGGARLTRTAAIKRYWMNVDRKKQIDEINRIIKSVRKALADQEVLRGTELYKQEIIDSLKVDLIQFRKARKAATKVPKKPLPTRYELEFHENPPPRPEDI